MAIGMTIGAGLAIYGSIRGRKARKKAQRAAALALRMRQRLSKKYADDEIRKGLSEADLIRRKAMKYRGSQMAQQAASGVVVGNGSAQAITERTLSLGEADALVAIEESKNKANRIMDKSKYDVMETGNKIEALAQQSKQQIIQSASRIASSFG